MAKFIKNTSVVFTLALVYLGCSDQEPKKSALVDQLETIFYADNFTSIPDKTFWVTDFGAVGDSTTLNTSAIQNTIDAAAKAGGGRVEFTPGTYLSGALFLKSNVELHLDEGVKIKAIQNDSHYPERPTRVAGFEMDWPSALVNVYEQHNVRITGKGIIDGNGKYWWDKFWGDPPRSGGMWVDYERKNVRWAVDYDCKRVRALVVYKSSDVLLKDFTVHRSGFWTISLTYSERVHVNGVTIRNNIGGYGPSSDGINTDSSSEILVENCDIDCNDDNLCIKSGRDADGLRVNRPAENIVYRNCITRSGHGLFTIGSETSGGMRNIEVYGLKAEGTNTGIRFKSAQVRGGVIENISFHDITMHNVKSPFQFELNWYPEYSYPEIPDEIPEDEIPDTWRLMTQKVTPPERGIPEFKNISLSNIEVKGATTAIYANAYAQKPMHDLRWNSISIEAEKGGEINYGKDWQMKNVTISIPDDEHIVLKGSKNIMLPEDLTLEVQPSNKADIDARMKQKIEKLVAQRLELGIIPVHGVTEEPIMEGDSISFTEEVTVYILSEKAKKMTYVEPLGDGFYMTPVTISFDKGTETLEVSGEKNHKWRFWIQRDTAPSSVKGADQWHYDKRKGVLEIEKEASRFKVSLH
ncbi:glycoside hydrolase family 28 protein [Pareuzebyella sediminis]|uniref:glycoside hydrolase family 28 protein n=1 Tax=Pareuzebyella sediminis TaxID=2607998 RepID=UPI0011EEF36A|nr:glycoside hydrolase family 28 protein [Pareuzebyella sediminis]